MSKISKGFTLIELLVVIFIISILATLVIINVSQARKSGRDAKRIANLKAIQTALELYYDRNSNSYPSIPYVINPSCFENGQNDVSNDTIGLAFHLLPYLEVMPKDPLPVSGTLSHGSDWCGDKNYTYGAPNWYGSDLDRANYLYRIEFSLEEDHGDAVGNAKKVTGQICDVTSGKSIKGRYCYALQMAK